MRVSGIGGRVAFFALAVALSACNGNGEVDDELPTDETDDAGDDDTAGDDRDDGPLVLVAPFRIPSPTEDAGVISGSDMADRILAACEEAQPEPTPDPCVVIAFEEVPHPDFDAGKFVETRPAQGTEVMGGSTVTIVVADASSPTGDGLDDGDDDGDDDGFEDDGLDDSGDDDDGGA